MERKRCPVSAPRGIPVIVVDGDRPMADAFYVDPDVRAATERVQRQAFHRALPLLSQLGAVAVHDDTRREWLREAENATRQLAYTKRETVRGCSERAAAHFTSMQWQAWWAAHNQTTPVYGAPRPLYVKRDHPPRSGTTPVYRFWLSRLSLEPPPTLPKPPAPDGVSSSSSSWGGITYYGYAHNIISSFLSSKLNLVRVIRAFRRSPDAGAAAARAAALDAAYLPPTFELTRRSECLDFFARDDLRTSSWILKAPRGHLGQGIERVTNFERQLMRPHGKCEPSSLSEEEAAAGKATEEGNAGATAAAAGSRRPDPIMVQRVIEPHLDLEQFGSLDAQGEADGHMYDMRSFLLVRAPGPGNPSRAHGGGDGGAPLEAYHLRASGHRRFCSEPYSKRSSSSAELAKYATICNHEVNGRNPRRWTSPDFGAKLRAPAAPLLDRYPQLSARVESMLLELVRIFRFVLEAAPPETYMRHNWFVVAVDFLVDTEKRPWLTELNFGCPGNGLGSDPEGLHADGFEPWELATHLITTARLRLTQRQQQQQGQRCAGHSASRTDVHADVRACIADGGAVAIT